MMIVNTVNDKANLQASDATTPGLLSPGARSGGHFSCWM